MPSSTAAATFSLKNLSAALPPGSSDIAVATVLRKQQGDATLSFAFSDASLKDPMSGQGMIVSAEKPLGDGVKGAIACDLSKRSAIGSVTLDKPLNGSNLQLKAIYKQAGDVFVLEETWKFDANNKLGGSYNFSTEEALFAYTYTKDDWSATGRYNIKKEIPVLEINKKQGKATIGAMYAPKDESAALSYNAKPYKAILKSKVGRGGVRDAQAFLTVTHEFEL